MKKIVHQELKYRQRHINTTKNIAWYWLCGGAVHLCSNKHNIVFLGSLFTMSKAAWNSIFPELSNWFYKTFLRFLVAQIEQGYDFSKVITTVENCRSQLKTQTLVYNGHLTIHCHLGLHLHHYFYNSSSPAKRNISVIRWDH